MFLTVSRGLFENDRVSGSFINNYLNLLYEHFKRQSSGANSRDKYRSRTPS